MFAVFKKLVKTLLQVVDNFTLKSVLMIFKKTMLNANLLNQIQLSLIKKLLQLNHPTPLCQNPKTNTIEFTELQNLFMKTCRASSKMVKFQPPKISKKELKD